MKCSSGYECHVVNVYDCLNNYGQCEPIRREARCFRKYMYMLRPVTASYRGDVIEMVGFNLCLMYQFIITSHNQSCGIYTAKYALLDSSVVTVVTSLVWKIVAKSKSNLYHWHSCALI